MNIPTEQALEFKGTLDEPTLSAISLVRATSLALEHVGLKVDVEELLGISSVAFNNYVYNPGYNQHELVDRNDSPYSELISNYGIFESVAHYTGVSIAEINGLSDDDIWKLIRFEVLNNRPFISMDTDFNVEIFSGYVSTEAEEKREVIANGKLISLRQKLQGDDPVFVNWGVITRLNDKIERTPLIRQQTNLLNWVVGHGFTQKEFFHETRENYACGVHGLEILGARITKGLDAKGFESLSRFISRLLIKRSAAAYCLRLWAGEIAEETNPEVEGLLGRAADEYEKLVALFSDDEEWTSLFPKAIEIERNALGFIRDASQYFPSVFG